MVNISSLILVMVSSRIARSSDSLSLPSASVCQAAERSWLAKLMASRSRSRSIRASGRPGRPGRPAPHPPGPAGPVRPGRAVAPVPRAPGRHDLRPGLGPGGLAEQFAAGPAGAVPDFLAGPAGLLPGRIAVRGTAVPALTARPGQLLAQAAHGVPNVLGHLAGNIPHRFGNLLLQVGQVVQLALDLGPALVGDPVDLPAADRVVGDQALFLQPGQPGVDRARRGRVHAHEPVLEQADDLVAVPGRLVQQLEQVQPELAVPEDGAHRAAPAGPGPPRCSRLTGADRVLTEILAPPPPSVPATLPGPEGVNASNPDRTRPDPDRRSTFALASAGSRTAISPDTVFTRRLPPESRSTSAVTLPAAVRASRVCTVPPARVRPPDTELKVRLPSRARVSTSPDTVLASTGPRTPSRVSPPLTLRTDTLAVIPDTIALAFTTPGWTGQPAGTVIVRSAECRCGRSQPSTPSQVRSS